MRRIVLFSVCSLILLLSAVVSAQDGAASDNAAFITDFTAKLAYLERQVSMARWQYLTTGRADSLDEYQEWYETLVGNSKNPEDFTHRITREKDTRLLRQLELLRRLTLRHVVDDSPEVKQYLDSQTRNLIDKPIEFEGKQYTADEMQAMLGTESNRQRRRTIYEAMLVPAAAKAEVIAQAAKLRNAAAAEFGYSSFYEMMLEANGIDKGQFEELLAEIDKLTEEPYQKIVDSLHRALNTSRLSAWDIDYAFRRATGQSAGYFVSDNFVRLAKATLDGLGIQMDALPIYFEPVAEGVSLENPELITVAIPHDFRIALSTAGGDDRFNRFVAAIFESLYGYNMDNAEFMFLRPPAPCLNEALYWLVTDMVETDSWNRKYAGMPEPLVLTMRTKHRFYRLYRIRQALAMIAFERALYKDPLADLNTHYTAIQDKYLDLTEIANGFPWAAEGDFIGAPVQSANELVGFVIGAQVSHYLSEKYGSLLDNQRTREFLVQNIFRFGAREDWQLLIERATGEPISPNYLISLSR
ncbi:MAG: hypothetical protein R3F48_10285 [Candidatus Zixiibacteriota bacterium]